MITGIIMASGFSRRMSKPKLLIDLEGKKVVERVVIAAKDSKLDELILVYRDEEVGKIGDEYKVKTVYNPKAILGQSQSVIQGVKNSPDSKAYMFIVGDQPYLSPKVIDRLIEEYEKSKDNIIVPFYNNEFGMPIIFPSKFKEELLEVQGDKGGNEIIKNNPDSIIKVHFKDWRLGFDIDCPEDLERII